MKHGWRAYAAAACVAAGTVGLCLQLGVRDAWPLTRLAFYALPPPVIAALVLFAAVLLRGTARRLVVVTCLVVGLALTGFAAARGLGTHACRADEPTLRLVLWNIGRGVGGWDAVAERLARLDADLIGLVEAGGRNPEREAFWRARFPQHAAFVAGPGLVVLVRGRLIATETQGVFGAWTASAVVEIGDRRLRVIVVDVDARPLTNRRPAVEGVFALAASRSDLPTVVMGDFNTPATSVWYDDARRSFVNAFEAAGRGWRATWPVPFPVLDLDQIWLSAGVRPLCARQAWSWRSDHRPVVVDLQPTGTLAAGKGTLNRSIVE